MYNSHLLKNMNSETLVIKFNLNVWLINGITKNHIGQSNSGNNDSKLSNFNRRQQPFPPVNDIYIGFAFLYPI